MTWRCRPAPAAIVNPSTPVGPRDIKPTPTGSLIVEAGRGAEPFVTVDGLRMSKKWMFVSSAKAERQLGYKARPAEAALADAVAWFREAGYLG